MPVQPRYPCPCCKRHEYVKVADNLHREITIIVDGEPLKAHRFARYRECVRDETKMANETGCGHEWETWELDVPSEKGGIRRQGIPPNAVLSMPNRRCTQLF